MLVARNIGPGELLDYSGRICGVVLEEGSIGSHATIVAAPMAITAIRRIVFVFIRCSPRTGTARTATG